MLSLPELVHRMTDRPARRFGLPDRGRIAPGYFADLVAFDPATIADTATYEDPMQFPIGIPLVIVNGKIAVRAGRCSGVLAGRAVP
jgi:N-acyl-D-amino-acid deacylase